MDKYTTKCPECKSTKLRDLYSEVLEVNNEYGDYIRCSCEMYMYSQCLECGAEFDGPVYKLSEEE